VTSQWLCHCCLERYLSQASTWSRAIGLPLAKNQRSDERYFVRSSGTARFAAALRAQPYQYNDDLTLGYVFGRRRLPQLPRPNSLFNFFLEDALHTRFYPFSIQFSLSRPPFLLPMLSVP